MLEVRLQIVRRHFRNKQERKGIGRQRLDETFQIIKDQASARTDNLKMLLFAINVCT